MTKTYVRTDYTGCSYLTAGKLYETLDVHEYTFSIKDDHGAKILCGWNSCYHTGEGNWEIVTVDFASELDLKVGDVVRVVDAGGWAKGAGTVYTLASKETHPNYCRGGLWLQGERFLSWMPLDDTLWTYEVISRANTEETPEWSSWMLSPQDGSLRKIGEESVENFELQKVNLDPEEPQFAYRYKRKEPKPQLEEGKVYYSEVGVKWECMAIRGDTAFLAAIYTEGYGSAHRFSLNGEPISLSHDPEYTIDFTKGEPTE